MEKSKNGITLIALVVTIVVLLILAGISISMTLEKNGIIYYALKAKNNSNGAMEKEKLELCAIAVIEDNEIKEEKLKEELDKNIGNNNYVIEGDGQYKITYKDTNNSYVIQGNGKVDIFRNIDTLQVGDYVNYTYEDSEIYTLMGQTNNAIEESVTKVKQEIPQTKDLKWRIFSKDDVTGKIELISETTTDINLVMGGTPGYTNGVNVLNNICEQQYSNKKLGVKARSIKIEDLYSKLNDAGKEIVKKSESKVAEIINNGTMRYPTLYKYVNGAKIDDGDIVTDGLGVSDKRTQNFSDWWSSTNSNITVKQTFTTFDDTSLYYNDIDYDMIFGDSSNNFYWVASRCSNIYSENNDTMMGIISIGNNNFLNGGGMAYTTGYWATIYNRKLRPIVTLDSSLLNNDSIKDENGVWQINE